MSGSEIIILPILGLNTLINIVNVSTVSSPKRFWYWLIRRNSLQINKADSLINFAQICKLLHKFSQNYKHKTLVNLAIGSSVHSCLLPAAGCNTTIKLDIGPDTIELVVFVNKDPSTNGISGFDIFYKNKYDQQVMQIMHKELSTLQLDKENNDKWIEVSGKKPGLGSILQRFAYMGDTQASRHAYGETCNER